MLKFSNINVITVKSRYKGHIGTAQKWLLYRRNPYIGVPYIEETLI